MANFDPKRVTPIEWAGIGAGVAAFLFSFFPWLSVDFGIGNISVSASAWNSGFLAWFAVMLLIGAGAVVFLPHIGTEVKNRTILWLSLAGAATVLILLRWVTSEGFASVGLFLGLLAALTSTAAAFLTFKAANRTTA